jgi:hypothetical protein
MVSGIIDRCAIDHLLDYHCGNLELAGLLSAERAFKYQAYDPAVEEFSEPPLPAEMVCAFNCIEYAQDPEEELDRLESLTESVLFLVVGTERQPIEWWLTRVCARFDLQSVQALDAENFFIIANNQGAELISH